jgi:hypothetical protein
MILARTNRNIDVLGPSVQLLMVMDKVVWRLRFHHAGLYRAHRNYHAGRDLIVEHGSPAMYLPVGYTKWNPDSSRLFSTTMRHGD